MNKMPFFSVIIPMYNSEQYIGNTLQSVLNQEYDDFEVIVIDDGSTDNGSKVVESFNDKRIKLVSKVNGGVSSARNRGIKEANGRYIAFLDSDDIWYPNHLKAAYYFFKVNAEVKWYSSSFIRSSANKPITIQTKMPVSYHIENFIKKAYAFIWTSCVIIERHLANSVGGFPENCGYGEDSVFWYKIGLREQSIGYTSSITAIYTVRENSITQTCNRINLAIDACIKAKEKYLVNDDYALQGMFTSMLVYHFKNRNYNDFLYLIKKLIPNLGWKLALRSVLQVPYLLLKK
ncbi:MAG: glycosyltransferase family 2 protein [Carboxylicivirga sp.]|jgi:glycosyltransferase involved in cell wall biosynthesis|nr:glycosyltransferase family 2 protein [Carboxylicivirga sp.]